VADSSAPEIRAMTSRD